MRAGGETTRQCHVEHPPSTLHLRITPQEALTCPRLTGAPVSAAKALNSLQTVGPALEDFISLKAGISKSAAFGPCGGSTFGTAT